MGSKVFTMVGGGAGGGIELQSIAITNPPDKVSYIPGETFAPAGMTVQATYSNGATMTATGWTFSPDGPLTEDDTEITVMYSEAGKTATATQAITVDRAEVAIPTYTGELTYTGQAQTPTFSGYDPAKMTMSGDTSATDAGDYAAIFTPTYQYKWPDGTTEGKSVAWSIERASVAVPTVSGTLTYDGTEQSPTWNGYDTSKMTIGGDTSGTNAGDYTATFVPLDNYQWSDGTTDTKSVAWSIGKAVPVLSLSPNSVSVSTDTPSATVAITYTGDGTLSVTSNSIAEGSIAGTTLTVTGLSTGETSLTVSATAGTNYQAASASVSVAAQFSPVGVDFATDSWETIIAVAEAGTASQYYSVGDTKDITISGVGTMTLEIADFDHDYLSGSTSAAKAGISMITRDLLPDTRAMNSSNTNIGGFPASALYDYLNGTILNGLPSDLRAGLKTIYKWYGTGNRTTNGQWHGCKVWMPLEYELFGTTTYSPAAEHSTGNARKYPIFTDNNSRIKKLNNGSGNETWYWEASPGASNAAGFCIVHSDGSASFINASAAGGVPFGLSV